jgi:hypothetical protein
MAADLGPGLARDLLDIGIRADVRVSSDTDFFARMERGESSLFALRFFCWTGDAQDVLDQVVHSPDSRQGLGAFNYSADSKVLSGLDTEIEAARRDLQVSVRLPKLQGALRRVADANLAIALVEGVDVTVASPGVDFTPRADGFLLARDVRLSR